MITNFINENIGPILSIFSGSSLLVAISSIVKAFSQKNLNTAFEKLTSNINLQGSNTSMLSTAITHLFSEVDNLKEGIEKVIKFANDIDLEGLKSSLKATLEELETYKAILAVKDDLISSYKKDIHDIKIMLIEAKGGSGYDLLETEQET